MHYVLSLILLEVSLHEYVVLNLITKAFGLILILLDDTL
jgi:hypothetical protein